MDLVPSRSNIVASGDEPAPAWGPHGAWAYGTPRPVSTVVPQKPRPAPQQAPKQDLDVTEKMTEVQLMEKYNDHTFHMAPKKPSPRRMGFPVSTSLVAVKWRAIRPFSIYKYDMKLAIVENGNKKSASFNKEEMMTVIMNLRQNSACMEILKNNFWSDFRSLLYSGESIPQTTFTVNTEDFPDA